MKRISVLTREDVQKIIRAEISKRLPGEIRAMKAQVEFVLEKLKSYAHWAENGNVDDAFPIKEIPLSVRCFNCLLNAGIKTAGDLRKTSANRLLRFHNFGSKSLEELRIVAGNYGIEIREFDDSPRFYPASTRALSGMSESNPTPQTPQTP